MCKFCAKDSPYIHFNKLDKEWFIQIEGNYDIDDYVHLYHIKYCPYCGRELGDEYGS